MELVLRASFTSSSDMDYLKAASRSARILLVTVVTMEVCARIDDWWNYDASPFGGYSINDLYHSDELGRWGKPYARFEKWRLNEVGLRGPDFAAHGVRVAVVGSSETFGLYESEDKEYPRVLEQKLRATCSARIDVANVAFPGLHPQTVLQRLDWIDHFTRPAVAVLYLPPANYAEVEVINRETPARDDRRVLWYAPEILEGIGRLRVVSRGTALLKRHAPTELLNLYRLWRILRLTEGSTISDDVPERRLERMRQDLLTLIQGFEAREVAVVLVTHASRFGEPLTDDDRYWLTAWRVFYPHISEAGLLRFERRANELIRSVAQSESVRLIDAADELDGRGDYFADFTHFTDAGATAMAEVLRPGVAAELSEHAQCR